MNVIVPRAPKPPRMKTQLIPAISHFILVQVESVELRTNVIAAYVAGGRSWEVGAVMDAMQASTADSYELAFNRACALVEQEDYAAAEQQLQLALRSGVVTLSLSLD